MTNLINHLKQLDKAQELLAQIVAIPEREDKDYISEDSKEEWEKDARLAVKLAGRALREIEKTNLSTIISLLEAGEKLRRAAKSYSEARGDFKLTKEQSDLNAAISEFDTIKKELE